MTDKRFRLSVNLEVDYTLPYDKEEVAHMPARNGGQTHKDRLCFGISSADKIQLLESKVNRFVSLLKGRIETVKKELDALL